MKQKADFTKVGACIFYKYIYPMFAKEFLFGDNYEDFAQIVSGHFILNEKQWASVLAEWEIKEHILN